VPVRHHAAAAQPPGRDDRLLRFSFRYLDTTHPAFDVRSRGGNYFRRLVARLRELSALRAEEFLNNRSASLRIHRIDFSDARVALDGFGIPEMSNADELAWQFALSANEHGRVHGFLKGETFFIRWLDPDHNLYPGGG
jgi:hypothetical protein